MKSNSGARSQQRDRLIPLVPKEAQARAAFMRGIAKGVSRNGGKVPTPESADWSEFEQVVVTAFGSIHLDVEDGRVKVVP
ncbi:hypothetical protein ABIE89_005727 [Bradyrhizobium niftali]|uniref:hypothetical protein n=1 Tax=Bradyrhizobium niftali TaxID=2560055 RepID=UPI0038334DE1